MNTLVIFMGLIVGCIVGGIIYHMGKLVGEREGRKALMTEIMKREIRSRIRDN